MDYQVGVEHADEEAWTLFRSTRLSATDVRDLAKGTPSAKRRIMNEKLTGERRNLGRARAPERGRIREQVIMDWAEPKFGITRSAAVLVHPHDERWVASPDGVGEAEVVEVKVSEDDLTPGPIRDNTLLTVAPDSAFDRTGYYDQMQWQMLVTGAHVALFIWEQHDGQWPHPVPLKPVPDWCWIERDSTRIAQLLQVASEFMRDLEERRTRPLKPTDMPLEVRALAQRAIAAAEEEAEAKGRKDAARNELTTWFLEHPEQDVFKDDLVGSVSFGLRGTTKTEFDETAAMEKSPVTYAKYTAWRERYTVTTEGAPKTSLTIRGVK